MNEKTVENAMQIIMHAGDARNCCQAALGAVAAGDMAEAGEHLKEADAKIAEAHHIQTDCIQGAIAGEEFDYNVLFAHAQDTLMTIYSEIMIAKQMCSIFAAYDERLKKLENK